MRIVESSCQVVETAAGILLSTSIGEPPAYRQHAIVQVTTDEGLTGWGEASPLPTFTGETIETVAAVLEKHWLPALIGEDPYDIRAIHAKLSRLLPGNTSARAAIDVALFDLVWKAARQPLYKHLGHHGHPALPRTFAIGVGGIEAVIDEALTWCGRGYTTIKLKIGTDPRQDVERVLAVRRAIPDRVKLRVDANAGYDLKSALWVLGKLDGVDIELAEQLTPAHDYQAWRVLKARAPMPLMADESLQSANDAMVLAGERLVDYFVIKLIKTGGILNALKIAAIAETAGIECIVSTPFDTAIGAAAAVHTAFVIGSASHSHDLPPLAIESDAPPGFIGRPLGSGLGVTEVPSEEASWATEAV